jgi:hypothetical protein
MYQPSKTLDLSPARTLSPEEKWRRTFGHRVKLDASGCWLFTGAVGTHGYGNVGYAKKHWTAHTLSLFLASGVEPSGTVRHTCDTKRCINPSHLIDGTPAENTADMIAKGRAGWQRHPERFLGGKPPRRAGATNGNAILTAEAVQSIRERNARGVSYSRLAREYGVGKTTVADVVRGETWAPEDVIAALSPTPVRPVREEISEAV